MNYVLFEVNFLYEAMIGEAAHLLNIHIDKDRKSKFDLIVKELRSRRAENERIIEDEKINSSIVKKAISISQ